MRLRVVRWVVAGLATIAAFAVSTWITGALILLQMIKDSGARWAVASALGVAVAALAAMWGYGFATEGELQEGAKSSGTSVIAEGEGSIAIRGSNRGVAATTDAITPVHAEASDTTQPSNSPADSVTAQGSRSIAIGGDNVGTAATGEGAHGRMQ